MKNVIKLSNDQIVSINVYPHRLFTVGSVEGYAKQYNESPEAALKRNATTAKERPFTDYAIAWLNPKAAVLSASAHFREQTRKQFETALPLNIGQLVEIEGRRYVLETAANDNVFCKPVGRAAHGHPKRNRYPGRRVVGIDVVVYVVTDALMHVKAMTASELASIVTTREHKKILALCIGETLTLKRDFGSMQMLVTATSI